MVTFFVKLRKFPSVLIFLLFLITNAFDVEFCQMLFFH